MNHDKPTRAGRRWLAAVLAIGIGHGLVTGAQAYADNGTAQTGTFDGINVREGWVVLGDQKLTLAGSMNVTTASGGVTRLESLAPGTLVGFTTSPNPKGGKPIVTRVWVLPKESR